MKINFGEWQLGHQKSNYNDAISFALFRVEEDRTRVVVNFADNGEMRYTRIPSNEAIGEPSFHLERDQMQAFMDTLWELGIRPKGRRFEAEIAIKHQHLQDMRKIAFNALGIKEE